MKGEEENKGEMVRAGCLGDGLPQISLERSTCQGVGPGWRGEVSLHTPRLN